MVPFVAERATITVDYRHVTADMRYTTDMTPAAAEAQIETARATFAVPAQEATKQERAINVRTLIVAAACSLGLLVLVLGPKEAAWPAAFMVGIFGGGEYVTRALKTVRDTKRLLPEKR